MDKPLVSQPETTTTTAATMAMSFPAPGFIKPGRRLIPRDAGAVPKYRSKIGRSEGTAVVLSTRSACPSTITPPTSLPVSSPCPSGSKIWPPGLSRTESQTLTSEKLFGELESLLCHDSKSAPAARLHSSAACGPYIQDFDDCSVDDILGLYDEDVAEPLEVSPSPSTVDFEHAQQPSPSREGALLVDQETLIRSEANTGGSTPPIMPVQKVHYLQLPVPEDNQHTKKGEYYAKAIAETYNFDLVYIAQLLWRTPLRSRYNASLPSRPVHGQLLAAYGLHLVPSPLQISCSFHHSVGCSGVSEYRDDNAKHGEFSYGYAIAFGAGHAPCCEDSSVPHDHRVVLAGYRMATPGKEKGVGMSERMRHGLYLSAQTMISSLLRFESQELTTRQIGN